MPFDQLVHGPSVSFLFGLQAVLVEDQTQLEVFKVAIDLPAALCTSERCQALGGVLSTVTHQDNVTFNRAVNLIVVSANRRGASALKGSSDELLVRASVQRRDFATWAPQALANQLEVHMDQNGCFAWAAVDLRWPEGRLLD